MGADSDHAVVVCNHLGQNVFQGFATLLKSTLKCNCLLQISIELDCRWRLFLCGDVAHFLVEAQHEVLLDAVTFFTYQDWCLKAFQESQTMEVVVSRV